MVVNDLHGNHEKNKQAIIIQIDEVLRRSKKYRMQPPEIAPFSLTKCQKCGKITISKLTLVYYGKR